MEPLPPNDPVWDLLRKAKHVEPRANFVRNVVREARQTPQEHGLLAKIRGWWQDNTAISPGLTWAAATAVVMLAASFALVTQQDASTTVASQSPVTISEEVLLTEIDFPIVPEFVSELNQMEQMGDLVAVQDTTQLTSREIHLLLY
jgi:hypothetical protein